MKKLTADTDGCILLRAAMQTALDAIGPELGARFKVGNASFDPAAGNITIKTQAIIEGGKSREQEEADRAAAAFEFETAVTVDGTRFEIVGYRARSSKRPWIVMHSGKRFAWPDSMAQKMFGKRTEAARRAEFATILKGGKR